MSKNALKRKSMENSEDFSSSDSDLDKELDDSSGEEFNDGYDENLMGGEEDMIKLDAMTEAEREQEIFKRIDRRGMLKTRWEIEKKLRLMKKEENRMLNKKDSAKEQSKERKKTEVDKKTKQNGMDLLKAKKERDVEKEKQEQEREGLRQKNWRVWLKSDTTPDVMGYFEELEELSRDQQKMLENSEYHDVKITCGGKVMTAQKSILTGRSSVFKAMFQSDSREITEVVINDVDPGAVQGMLNWIYTGHMGDGRESLVLDILKLAHIYKLRKLMENCERKLVSHLNNENIVDILVAADLVDAKDLKNAAIKFVIGNKSIVQTQEFKAKVSRDLLAEIFLATDK